MDVTGTTGTAWRNGELVGDFILRGGRRATARGREVEHVEIRFLDFVDVDVRRALTAIERRQRLSAPLIVDLNLRNGTKLSNCEIAGFWGGSMGERWYGISLDLDLIPS